MIRKLKSGEYRIYSRKTDPDTGKRRNLGTFRSLAAAKNTKKRSNTSPKGVLQTNDTNDRHIL